jgi:hypothetical protein
MGAAAAAVSWRLQTGRPANSQAREGRIQISVRDRPVELTHCLEEEQLCGLMYTADTKYSSHITLMQASFNSRMGAGRPQSLAKHTAIKLFPLCDVRTLRVISDFPR